MIGLVICLVAAGWSQALVSPPRAIAADEAFPFDDDERRQLETAADGSRRFDEGALYPLLRNTLEWDRDRHAIGARIPDYDALREHPDAHRGQLMLIEGSYQGSGPFHLTRSGPWGKTLTWWVIKHGPTPDDVAVVYLIDPAGELPEPRRGAEVRVVARFYKIWRDIDDPTGEPTDFLTFVGRYPQITGTTGVTGVALLPPGLAPMLLVLVLAVAALIYVLRRSWNLSLQPRPLPSRHAHAAHTTTDAVPPDKADEPGDDLPEPPLPDDPADALTDLARRREKTHGESKNDNQPTPENEPRP